MIYKCLRCLAFLLVCGYSFIVLTAIAGDEPNTMRSTLLTRAFGGQVIEAPKTLWLDKELKQQLKQYFGYDLKALRIRYWAQGDTSVWILDEVGKEQPITMGIIVGSEGIKNIEVLEYRESRGGEIQFPFFTQQFRQATLDDENNKYKLDRNIDGITGATLSVRAMVKVAKVALFLNQKIIDVKQD